MKHSLLILFGGDGAVPANAIVDINAIAIVDINGAFVVTG